MSIPRHLLFLLLLVAAAMDTVAFGQSRPVLAGMDAVDNSRYVQLKGNVHPLAKAAYDKGPVPDSFQAERMLLVLKRSAERESALEKFIKDAHTPGSGSYHLWLTPDEFGRVYGPADSDVAVISSWLQSQGFAVARASKGKTAIEFSGNAAQVRQAFHTEIHTYAAGDVVHHANNFDPQIPAALTSLVAGITALNDFAPKSQAKVLGHVSVNLNTRQTTSDWTVGTGALAFAPADFAIQYNVGPVYNAGTNGAGVTIGIIGASNVDPQVIAQYRSLFGLSANPLKVVIDGVDPGMNAARIESYLDVEVAGSVAPAANITLYTSAGTSLQYGLDLAALRAVDDDEASVLSTSYGQCEQQMGAAENQFWANVWEQAAAQGQTSFVSSGDGGPAGCDDFNFPEAAQRGLAVNGIASTPWNVAVGGTDFYYSSYSQGAAAQKTELASYWNLTAAKLPSASILKPIPEQPWNNAFGLNLSDGGVYDPNAPLIVAGSGGVSSCSSGVDITNQTCSSGYSKPDWQVGAGVPADGKRDLPDISLYAAIGVNDSFYPICSYAGECEIVDGGFAGLTEIGGTSASSPAMAGIMALINQKYGPQGQANYTFYPLATQYPTAFHDIKVGSNNVPCTQNTPDCTLSILTDNSAGDYTLGHYYATAGYDLATGLGSLDVAALLKYWNAITFNSTTTTLQASQTSFAHGTPVTLSVDVTGSGGTPSGNVALVTTATPTVNTGLGELTLQNGSASSSIKTLPGGQYTLSARYSGDGLFATSTSSPLSLNVTPEDSITTLSSSVFVNGSGYTSISNGGTYPYGSYITFYVKPSGVNAASGSTDGIATGTVTFADSVSTGATNSGALNLTSAGVAQWIPSAFVVGSHSLSASYSGDKSFNASSSAPLSFSISKGTPTVSLSASPTVVGNGLSTTLTALVIASSNAPPPTGTATFYYGQTTLGTATLGTDPYNSHVGMATLAVTSLPIGTDAVSATYGGDANCDSATSSSVNIVVKQAASFSLTVNPNPVIQGQSFTVTAATSGPSGVVAPTGFVTFEAVGGGNSWTTTSPLTNGSAITSFPANYFESNSIVVYASYMGDSTYAPVSGNISVSVAPPFSVAGTTVNIAVPGATSGNVSTITVTPAGGFLGAVSLTCTAGIAPAGAVYPPSCTIPASVNMTDGNAATTTMTITSTAATSAALNSPRPKQTRWLAAKTAPILLGILLIGVPRQVRKRRWIAMSFCAVIMLVIMMSCGGGSSSGRAPAIAGTTPGTYTFSVNATSAGSLAHCIVRVTIQ